MPLRNTLSNDRRAFNRYCFSYSYMELSHLSGPHNTSCLLSKLRLIASKSSRPPFAPNQACHCGNLPQD